MVVGTVILSAILFVSFLDALPILARYGVSSIVCSLLLHLELSGLRYKLREKDLADSVGRRNMELAGIDDRPAMPEIRLNRTV